MGKAEDGVLATGEEIVAAAAVEVERLAALRRRWHRALYDLGWLGVVSSGWVLIGCSGLELGPLSSTKADAILRDLEDLGRLRPSTPIAACEGQLNLF